MFRDEDIHDVIRQEKARVDIPLGQRDPEGEATGGNPDDLTKQFYRTSTKIKESRSDYRQTKEVRRWIRDATALQREKRSLAWKQHLATREYKWKKEALILAAAKIGVPVNIPMPKRFVDVKTYRSRLRDMTANMNLTRDFRFRFRTENRVVVATKLGTWEDHYNKQRNDV